MSQEESAPELVSLYLRQAKQLCLLIGKRHRLSTEYCPLHHDPDEDPAQKEQVKKLVDVQLGIDEQVKKLIAFETEHSLGLSRLDKEITEHQAVYISGILLLVMKLNPSLKRHARTIGEIIEVAAGPNEDAHLTRMAFRGCGCLRPFITIGDLDTDGLEEQHCTLTDVAYCNALWIKPDDEECARSVVSRIDKYLTRRR